MNWKKILLKGFYFDLASTAFGFVFVFIFGISANNYLDSFLSGEITFQRLFGVFLILYLVGMIFRGWLIGFIQKKVGD